MTRQPPVAPPNRISAHHKAYMIIYLPMLLYFAVAEECSQWLRTRRDRSSAPGRPGMPGP